MGMVKNIMDKIGIFLFSLLIVWSSTSVSQPLESSKIFVTPDSSMFRLSPDGKFVTTYSRGKNNHYINLISLETNEMLYSSAIGNDNRLLSYNWLNATQLYMKVRYKNRNVYLLGEIENNVIKLVHIKAYGYLVHTLPEQPNKVMFAKSKRRLWQYHDLFIIDINALAEDDFSNAHEIDHSLSEVNEYFFDDEFNRIIARKYDEEEETTTLLYAVLDEDDWQTIFKLDDVDYEFKYAGFISDQVVGVLTNKDTDKMVLREFDIKTQTLGKIIYQHPKYDLYSASFLENGQLEFVSYYQHGLAQILYFDKGKARYLERLRNTFENKEVYVIGRSDDKNIDLLYVNGSTEPGEYLVYRKKSDQISRLSVSYSELADQKFAQSELLTVTASDGTELEAFLTLPIGIDHKTLLVMPHGGPISVRESDRFNKEIQYYASRGFSVLRVNFRGSSGFGKAFQSRGVGEFGQLIEEDISAAVKLARQKYSFEKMCAMGASYGGYSSTMLAIKHPEKYQCVVGAFGVYDLPLLFNASNLRSGKEYEKYMSKTVGAYSEKLVDVSPVYLYKKLNTPILLIAGRDDDTADFEHTNRFSYLLKIKKHPVKTMFYRDTGHAHRNWWGHRHEAAITYEFLMETLQLELPKTEKLDDKGKLAVADDFAIIADGYAFDNTVDDDKNKAFEYYRKAAAYDHPRSNFNIGVYYHQGEIVDANVAEAVKYYRKSAKLDYASAYGRLGRMYMEGEYFQQDWDKAFENLAKAQELESTPVNNIRLARLHCMAPSPHRNIDRCLELMNLEQYERHSKSRLESAKKLIGEALTWIIADAELSDKEYARIKKFAIDVYEVKETRVTVENRREGHFEYVESEIFGRKSEYQTQVKGFKIKKSEKDEERFGLIFEVDVPGINNRQKQVAMGVRWSVTTPDGRKKYVDSYVLYGSPDGRWNALRGFGSVREDAIWALEIFDLDRNRIYQAHYELSL
ncbi:alpha/beta fold hydrolase [Aliikangiella coralliicola]|uniref:Alpha/beta fold hydrolase n=1 Tax=Aliikangiella coralliicola TaxID=2592383 RepID=A0A545UG79_9GAMM|nr:alpha/beta fold hydrolase [Aliikangiella coralliicola]TQV88403.1 alpha/beta fold hydrolase [Aliikangiella coralliicola]